MLTQINPGAILPFYSESVTSMAHTRHVTGHGDGWKILASNRRLIPFVFWRDAAPATVDNFQAVNLTTGRVYDLSTSLVRRYKRADDSRTWYVYPDEDISEVLPCGTYSIRVVLSGTGYISDAIEVIDIRGPEVQRLNASGCALGVLEITATDDVIDSVDSEKFEWRLTSSGGWSTLAASSGPPYVYEFDLSAITLQAGHNVQIRRTVRTANGNTLLGLWSLTWGNADPCGTYDLFQIDDDSTYIEPDIWIIELSDPGKWGAKIFPSFFTERIYLRAHLNVPEIEREVETLTSNTGARILQTADTREIMVLQIEQIPDQLIYPLSGIPDYETVAIYAASKAVSFSPYEFSLSRGEIEFTFDAAAGRYYSQGALRWRNNKHFEGCDDEELVTFVA